MEGYDPRDAYVLLMDFGKRGETAYHRTYIRIYPKECIEHGRRGMETLEMELNGRQYGNLFTLIFAPILSIAFGAEDAIELFSQATAICAIEHMTKLTSNEHTFDAKPTDWASVLDDAVCYDDLISLFKGRGWIK